MREADIMEGLDHPYLVKMYDSFIDVERVVKYKNQAPPPGESPIRAGHAAGPVVDEKTNQEDFKASVAGTRMGGFGGLGQKQTVQET
jgi:hypothetical protein